MPPALTVKDATNHRDGSKAHPVVNQGQGRRVAGILTVPFLGDSAIVCLLFDLCMEVQGCVDGHCVCGGVTGSGEA